MVIQSLTITKVLILPSLIGMQDKPGEGVELGKAESEAVRSGNKAYSEHQRAENAESQVREMLGIPEIKEIWESIQQKKEAFRRQIDQWIEDGVAAIMEYANGKDNDFHQKQGNAVAWGIIAEAFRYGLDPTDEKQRRMAAAYLLEKVSWTGITDSKANLTALRTRQLCDAMMVTKDLMENLLLAAGGRAGISTQVAVVLMVSLPTGTARRKRLDGE